MASERSNFEGAENIAKLEAGPTAPNPGPTLLKQAEAAENTVSKSNGSSERSRNTTAKMIKYRVK